MLRVNNTVMGFCSCRSYEYCYVLVLLVGLAKQCLEQQCCLKHFQLVQLAAFTHGPNFV